VALSAVLLAGACGGSSKPATSPTTTASTTATTSAVTPTTTPSTTAAPPTTAAAATTTTTPGVARCVASKLKGSFLVIPGSAGAGHVEARVVLTNISSAPCTTFGYVGMQLLGASDTPLPTHVVRSPGSEPAITLAPGGSASATARFSPDIPGPGDAPSGACQPVAQGTEITPPNDTHFVVAPGLMSSVCSQGTIDLNPLQAGANAGP
jgi:hypothetical protein